MQDVTDARAGGQRREKDFGLFGGSGDGGVEIEREQRGKCGGLCGVGGGGQLRGEAVFEQGPARGLARGLQGHRAQGGPELDEGAEDGGFGELATEQFANGDGGHLAFAIESFPGAQDDGRSAAAGRGFPLAVSADGSGPGQDFGGDEEVGLLGEGAEKIERDDAAIGDEAGSELGGVGDRCWGWGHAGRAGAGFNEGGRGCGKLGVAREKEAKADVVEPARGVVEGDERGGGVRCGGLMPERGARDL